MVAGRRSAARRSGDCNPSRDMSRVGLIWILRSSWIGQFLVVVAAVAVRRLG